MDAQNADVRLRCGDVVKHRPSDENWIVAFADYEANELAPAGWPDSRADISDCDIVSRCSDEEYRRWVSEWTSLKTPCSRRSRVLRLYGEAPQAAAAPPAVDFSAIEKRIIDSAMTATGREHIEFGSNTYAGVVKQRNRFRLTLINQARMLACWGPECFPAAPNGQIHFARALMESAAKEMTEAVGVPYPVEDAEPAANPIAGTIKLLERIQQSLAHLNGVYATDLQPGPGFSDPAKHWVVDVIIELEGVDRLLEVLRGASA